MKLPTISISIPAVYRAIRWLWRRTHAQVTQLARVFRSTH